ncbi:unnamed protein product, partial [marine sediment metagenome]
MDSKNHYCQIEEIKYWNSRQLLKEEQKALDWIEKGGVLDIGCGSGIFLKYLRKKGLKELIGLDISLGMLKKAKTNGFSEGRIQA